MIITSLFIVRNIQVYTVQEPHKQTPPYVYWRYLDTQLHKGPFTDVAAAMQSVSLHESPPPAGKLVRVDFVNKRRMLTIV